MEPTKEQMFRAYDAAPKVVRKALQPEGLALQFVEDMADQYKLHADVAGVISILIRNMILGFVSPSEFSHELQKSGVTEATARQLLIDLNMKVFVPLRNQVRGEGGAYPSHPPQAHVPDISKPSLVPELPASEKPSPATSINVMDSLKQKAAVSAAAPAPLPSPSVPVPTMRTMQHDMELVQHGDKPVPYPASNSQLHPAQTTPARMFQTASVPVTASAAPAPHIPEIVHIIPDAPKSLPRPVSKVASAQEYTSDPYRESI